MKKGSKNSKIDLPDQIDFSSGAAAVNAERSERGYSFGKFSGITPSNVGAAIRAYKTGEFNFCAPLLENISSYDSQVETCISKRLAMTECADWEVLEEQDSDGSNRNLAQEQAEVIRDFFNNISVSSAMAQDQELSVSALVRHIAEAIGYGYSAAALTWVPARIASSGRMTQHCQVMTCPLRFFEARERVLKIHEKYGTFNGAPLKRGLWLVAHSSSTPLLLPTLFAYMFKSTPLEDWAHVVEKFGIPFVTAKTPATYGSKEWHDAEEALRRVGSGFAGLFGKDIDLEIQALAQTNAPHSVIVDYIDRSISRLWLGGDLSTMSQIGEANGSMSQVSSEGYLRKKDRAFVEQVIDSQLVRPLLNRVFGGVRQLAYFKFKETESKDLDSAIKRITKAQEMKLPMSKAFVYAELGIPMPKAWEEKIDYGQEAQTPAGSEVEEGGSTGEDFGNARSSRSVAVDLAKAQYAQFEELISRLRALEGLESESDFANAVAKLETDFPKMQERILSKNNIADAISDAIMAQVKMNDGQEDFKIDPSLTT